MSKQSNAQIVGIDVTCPAEGEKGYDFNVVSKLCREWFKKYCFQKERGEPTDTNPEGYLHWQIRGHLYKKKRVCELIKHDSFFPSGHVSPTTTGVHQGTDFNYVMKADSRVDGPWTDLDYEEPPVLTRQLRTFMGYEKYPWQEQIEAMTYQEDDRWINVIYDIHGKAGKSVFVEYLVYHRRGFEVPTFRQMEDIMQCVMSVKAQKCYFIDMPRGMKKDRLGEFYSGIECLKNGVCYDKRYSFKMRRFDRPQIFIFTNVLPQFELLTKDRWQIWEMDDKFTLHRYQF